MPTRSSDTTTIQIAGTSRLPWYSTRLDWPCERVVAEVEVMAPRELDVIEWAVARILEQFPEQTPSLAEATAELGLHASVFLAETLQELIRIGAVQSQQPSGRLDLRGCSLTPLGRTLLTQGRVTGIAERHGLHLFFDAVTGEHLPSEPKCLRTPSDTPIIRPDQLPARVTDIGLDRVRTLARAQGEPYQQGESQISNVRVRYEEGEHLWMQVPLTLSISKAGQFEARVGDTSGARQTWFEQHGWEEQFIAGLKCVSTAAWANGRCHSREAPAAFQEWLRQVDRLLPPTSTVSEAVALVEEAQEEAVLHSGWLDAPELAKAVAVAAERGVRCYVCGAADSVTAWSEIPGKTPGFMVAGGAGGSVRPLALIVDRARGLRIDRLVLKTSSGGEIEVEVTSTVQPAVIEPLRERLTSGLAGELGQHGPQHLLAAFALTGQLAFWQAGVRLIESQALRLEQITRLRQLGEWGQQLGAQTDPAMEWLGPAVRQWFVALKTAREDLDRFTQLLDIAVGLVSPADILNELSLLIAPTPADQDPQPLSLLLIWAGEVRRRWTLSEPVRQCPRFTALGRACLNAADPDRCRQAVNEVVQLLQDRPAFASQGAAWCAILSSLLPAPHDLTSLMDWLECHGPLIPHLGGEFRGQAVQQVETVRPVLRKAIAEGSPLIRQLRDAWVSLGLPEDVLADRRNVATNAVGTVPAAQTRLKR